MPLKRPDGCQMPANTELGLSLGLPYNAVLHAVEMSDERSQQ